MAISELKRVNNLLNEAEFHALKTIKVPAKADSLLTELLPEVSYKSTVVIHGTKIERLLSSTAFIFNNVYFLYRPLLEHLDD